jgi:hypothetical protein
MSFRELNDEPRGLVDIEKMGIIARHNRARRNPG